MEFGCVVVQVPLVPKPHHQLCEILGERVRRPPQATRYITYLKYLLVPARWAP